MPGPIPGLTGERAVAFLGEQGYSCSGMTTNTSGQAVWSCSRGRAGTGFVQVEVNGDNATSIRRIAAVASGPGVASEDMRGLIAGLATVPYEGAQPSAAKSWIEQNYDRRAQTRFSGVAFTLAPQASGARALRIGEN